MLLEWCQKKKISLVPVPIKVLLNVETDSLSRLTSQEAEWTLDTQSFKWIVDRQGLPQVNLFATEENHKVQNFFSPCPSNRAHVVNAFAQNWAICKNVYGFPPVNCLGSVAEYLRDATCRPPVISILAPYWPSAKWFYLLRKYLPYQFKIPEVQLSQQAQNEVVTHSLPECFNLYLWHS